MIYDAKTFIGADILVHTSFLILIERRKIIKMCFIVYIV